MSLDHASKSEMEHRNTEKQVVVKHMSSENINEKNEPVQNENIKRKKTLDFMPEALNLDIIEKKNRNVADYLKDNHGQLTDVRKNLKKHTWHWKMVAKFDSPAMRDVNNSIEKVMKLLDKFFTDDELNSEAAFTKRLGKIQDAYKAAVKATEYYMTKRRDAKTKSGKERLKMVTELNLWLKDEENFFAVSSWQMLGQAHENGINLSGKKWADALYYARAEKLNLKEGSGGATGSIKKFTDEKDGKLKFYKKEEIIIRDEQRFIDIVSDMELKEYEKLSEEDIKNLNEDDKAKYEWLQVYKKLKSCAPEMQEKFIDDFADTLEKYVKAIEEDNEWKQEKIVEELRKLCNVKKDLSAETQQKLKEVMDCLVLEKGDAVFNRVRNRYMANGEKPTKEMNGRIQKEAEDEWNRAMEKNDIVMRGLKQIYGVIKTANIAMYNHIKAGTPLSLRNVATSRMENILFGERYQKDHLIAKSTTVIQTNGKKYVRGNVMEGAEGCECSDLGKKRKNRYNNCKVTIKPEALQRVSDLMVMDYIVGQMDRHAGNFFLKYDIVEKNGDATKIVITGVTGIDNDMSFTDFSAGHLKKNSGRNRLEDIHNIKAISADLARRICSIDISQVEYKLADLGIRKEEFKAMASRISELKEYITRAEENGLIICRNREDWEAQSLASLDSRELKKEHFATHGEDRAEVDREESKMTRGLAHMMRRKLTDSGVDDIGTEKTA